MRIKKYQFAFEFDGYDMETAESFCRSLLHNAKKPMVNKNEGCFNGLLREIDPEKKDHKTIEVDV